ncbi:MAG TPA: ORF6N domain-containing protein [Chthoniobacteraceae bacterium]|nr:ORF6N domain-containing protein [Chthoniobacteraceae bacterium]
MNDDDNFDAFFKEATKHAPYDYQRRLACGERGNRLEARWLMHFGLLNNDALWVMDETQLMGPALWTSAQLDWMRLERFPSLFPCPTWWMSATVGAAFLKTSERERAKFPLPLSLVFGDDAQPPRQQLHLRTSTIRACMRESAPIPILNLRGLPVLIDADLARLYGVPTKRLNEQVRRNQDRFPADFLFELTSKEKTEVVATCDHLKNLKFSKALPHAFTEHGALMAANVLNSPEAVKMSVFIIRAFIKQREALSANATILKRLAEIDKTLLVHDSALRDLYQKLLPLLRPPPDKPRPRIGFGTQDDR